MLVRLDHVALRLHDKREKRMKYWEIIADNLKKRGWSLGWVSAVDSQARTIWIADAHRDDEHGRMGSEPSIDTP